MKGLSAKQKLIAASLTMLIALAMIVGTTLAWYTISTNPEVSGMTFNIAGPETLRLARYVEGTEPDLLDYHETLNLTDLFSSYMNLVPVSTADLVNWFIPTYDELGALKDPNEFILDTTLSYANIGKYALSGGMLQYEVDGVYYTEAELRVKYAGEVNSEAMISSAMQNPKELSLLEQIQSSETGYYVYADMWMTTDNEYGSIVRLSYPHYSVEDATSNNDMGGGFGTYVLPKLGLGLDASNNSFVKSVSNNSETSVRIGFQIYGNQSDPDEVTAWYIYEPNADRHSLYTKKPSGSSAYVIGFDTADVTLSDGIYSETLPIGRVQTGTQNDGSGNMVPVYTNMPVSVVSSHSITQFASAWKTDTTTLSALSLNKKLDSTYLDFFGKITSSAQLRSLANASADKTLKLTQTLSPFSQFTDEEAAASASLETSYITDPLFTVEYGQYVRIRMFVWIEGQDADCWNDVASGSFRVNLEFSETSLHPENDVESEHD